MRIFSERGRNDVMFAFTEYKFTNKIRSFQRFAKKSLKKFHKRDKKIRGVYLDYTWGYKSKEPKEYFTRHKLPEGVPLTPKNIMDFALADMSEKHDIYIDASDPDGRNIYYLRAIQVNYIYENVT